MRSVSRTIARVSRCAPIIPCADLEAQRRDLGRKNCQDFVEVVVGEHRRLDGWRRLGQLLLAGAAVLVVVYGVALFGIYGSTSCHPWPGEASRLAASAPLALSRRDSTAIEVLPRAGCPYLVGVRIQGRSDFPQSYDRRLPFSVDISIDGLPSVARECNGTRDTYRSIGYSGTEQRIYLCSFDVPARFPKNRGVRISATVVKPNEEFARMYSSRGLFAILVSDY